MRSHALRDWELGQNIFFIQTNMCCDVYVKQINWTFEER